LTKNPAVAAVGSGLPAPVVISKLAAAKLANGTTNVARRVISSAALCNNCHDQLGTNPNFHSGQRNDPTACQFCHTPNKADSATGQQVNTSTWLHGIHGATKRTVPYVGASTDFSSVLYPGLLKDCNQCHLPNTVNFGNGSAGQGGGLVGNNTLQNSLLWTTTTIGTPSATGSAASFAVTNSQLNKTTNTTITRSPLVTIGTNYGSAYSASTNAASAVASYTAAAGGTAVATYAQGSSVSLVNSPVTSACSACHTDSVAINHMKSNGGVYYDARANHVGAAVADVNSTSDGSGLTAASSVAGQVRPLINSEGCLVCHGQGTIMDAAVIHQNQ
jgi:OmcA/MtrC family decaheme c-type cytochrome